MERSLREIFVEKYGPETKTQEGLNSRHKCPKCGENSLACHLSKGVAKCWHCDFLEWIKGTPSVENAIQIDKTLQLKVTQKLLEISEITKVHKDYLAKRGIYNPELYKIATVPLQAEKQLLNYFTKEELLSAGFIYEVDGAVKPRACIKSRRIIIPHWQGDKVIAFKSRIRPFVDVLDTKEPRYASPEGSGVGNNLWWKGKLGRDGILTEGELCAIATTQAGITTCGLPGLKAAMNITVLNQLKDLIKESGTERLFVIFDTDEGIAEDKHKLLCAINIKKFLGSKVAILYLPQDYENESMDLDLYLGRYDIDDLYALMEDAWIKKEQIYRGLISRVKRLNERREGSTETGKVSGCSVR